MWQLASTIRDRSEVAWESWTQQAIIYVFIYVYNICKVIYMWLYIYVSFYIYIHTKLTFGMLTAMAQWHSFSTDERMFWRNCQNFYIQSSAIITRPTYQDITHNMALRVAEYKSDFKFTRDNPYLARTGELWSVFCEYFGGNWPRYNGTALYV